MKRFKLLIVCSLLLFVLSACGTSSNSSMIIKDVSADTERISNSESSSNSGLKSMVVKDIDNDVKSNDSGDNSEEQVKSFSVGDVIKTVDYEATVSDVVFSYEVTPSDTSGLYYSYPADNGKVFVDIRFDVKNLMKRDIMLRDLFSVGALYDDGYSYKGFTALDTGTNLLDSSSWVVAEPLSTGTVHGIIECPEEVKTSENHLTVQIKVGDVLYEYAMK
ncbi:MAG: hypothetical protein K5767_08625 [Clostridia bacterium]|nr:hypothetical protein [Clostridia bacterium]